MSIEYLQIGSNPGDLCLYCDEDKKYPGKWFTNFFRGQGHEYIPLLTADTVEAMASSREEALERIKKILVFCSTYTLFQIVAPQRMDEFQKILQKAGYVLETDEVKTLYEKLDQRRISFVEGVIKPDCILNTAMIEEIMQRFLTSDTVDTSIKPLKSFPALVTTKGV